MPAGMGWHQVLGAARVAGGRPPLLEDAWAAVIDPYRTGAWQRRLAWGGLLGNESVSPVERPDPLLVDRTTSQQWSGRPLGAREEEIPYHHALHPLVNQAWRRLDSESDTAMLTQDARSDLRCALAVRLSELMAEPLTCLFAGERTLADVALAHVLDGRPVGGSVQKYMDFCEAQVETNFSDLFMRFPVVRRLLDRLVANWAEASRELLLYLRNDRLPLQQKFGIPMDTSVQAVQGGLGDPHNLGRGVAALTFADGSRLIYKPRSVAMEARYYDFVRALGERLPGRPLRVLKVLALPGHGYVEFVESAPAEELSAFYHNAGRVLALLHLLGATDCHWENLVACEDQLLLIDAETLLEGVPVPSAARRGSEALSDTTDRMTSSVLRTGMLPGWISVGPANSIDISALGVPSDGDGPVTRPAACFINTDDMVWGNRETTSSHPRCLPVSPGNENPLHAHEDELQAGFSEALRMLGSGHLRAEFQARIEAFRGSSRRAVVRATRTYAILQQQATELEALRDPCTRALQLERLARAYVNEEEMPSTWPILEYEIAALEELDVPYFEGEVGKAAVLVRGRTVVPAYYEREGLQQAFDRLASLDEEEIAWQAKLISGSIDAHRFAMSAHPPQALAEQVGDRGGQHTVGDIVQVIRDAALPDPTGPPTWLTVGLLTDATRVQLGLIPHGLYDGRAGLAAFLYDAGEEDLAAQVLLPIVEALEGERSRVFQYVKNLGPGMAGTGGLLRLIRYQLDRDRGSNWERRADALLDALTPELLGGWQASDLVSGLAGLAAPIAAIATAVEPRRCRAILGLVGAALRDRQGPDGGWPLAPGHPALVGLSHGASGTALALAEIAGSLEDYSYGAAVGRAIDFETRHFDLATGNWPDLRRGTPPSARLEMRSWCHGAIGVALARMRLIELLPDHDDAPRWRQELAVAIEGSVSAGSIGLDHLCCGDLGRAVALSLAGQSASNRHWQEQGRLLGRQVVSRVGSDPKNYRLLLGMTGQHGLRLPGLMTGLSGVGMYVQHGENLQWARRLVF